MITKKIGNQKGRNKERINSVYYPNSSKKLLILVGGSGNTKDDFQPIAESLLKKEFNYSLLLFSFRGYESKRYLPINQQIDDLKEVVRFAKDDLNYNRIFLMATSMGAYSTCFLLSDSKYNDLIEEVLFLDPCDYDIRKASKNELFACKGYEEYKQTDSMATKLLEKITSNVKVHVIRQTLRNHGPKGYISKNYNERGKERDDLYPRLNEKMIRTFYDKSPKANKGIYKEVDNLPHAFIRDGDIDKNMEKVSEIILETFNK